MKNVQVAIWLSTLARPFPCSCMEENRCWRSSNSDICESVRACRANSLSQSQTVSAHVPRQRYRWGGLTRRPSTLLRQLWGVSGHGIDGSGGTKHRDVWIPVGALVTYEPLFYSVLMNERYGGRALVMSKLARVCHIDEGWCARRYSLR